MLTFGRYTIDKAHRILRRDTDVVAIGGKAFDVLCVLVEARGTLVTKDALIEHVWDGRIINDNALEAQIHALRRSLGPDKHLVRTVAGKGYQITETERPPAAPRTNLPAEISKLISRDQMIDSICDALGSERLVTLLGPGGIGKTRLGLAAGRRVLDRFADGVWMVELAPIESPRFVCIAIADALGVTLGVLISTEN